VINPVRSFKTYNHVLGLQGFLKAVMVHFTRKPIVLDAKVDGFAAPVHVRIPSTDLMVYEQVILRQEYDLPVQRQPSFIVDAGANIGFASVFFTNRYPNARILSLEPEKNNYEILARNVAPYPNITAVRGALWSETTDLNVIDTGLGNWGFRVGAQNGSSSGTPDQTVHAMSVESILRDFGVEKIDILKIDIEGSELEIFQNADRWIDKVDSLVVELHEQLRTGCNRAFYNATNDFEHEWLQGELVCLTRSDGCLIPQKQAVRS